MLDVVTTRLPRYMSWRGSLYMKWVPDRSQIEAGGTYLGYMYLVISHYFPPIAFSIALDILIVHV